ncbi:MAG TPA: DUF4012 domain-containing protein [Patescibacteria group bacterium]|nr:DUF4012 domain-containing protein [Patescibacteria group bacterium]
MDDSGFKKIEFNRPARVKKVAPNPTAVPQEEGKINIGAQIKPMKKKFFKFNKKSFGIGGIIIAIIVLIGIYSFIKGIAIYKQAQVVYKQAKVASAAAKTQNIVAAHDALVQTKAETIKLQGDINGVGFLKFVPILGGYVSDASHMAGAGVHGINAAIITTESLIPYADVLGLKGEKSFAGGSAEERIRTAVKTLDKVVPRIDDIEREVQAAQDEMDKVNINHYPNFLFFKKIRTQLATAKTLVADGALAVDEGKPLIKVLPELLGANTSKKYLVLFQNDKELRPTGGFLTFYSIFRIDQGVIHIDSSNDIYTLDNSISYHPTADPIILKYLPKVPTQNIRDINLSPDFPTSMKGFMTYYDKSSLKTDIDGIIAIDTQFVVHLIDILGEVQADGQTFTAKTDPGCDCPQVVYQLEQNTTKPVNYIKTNRKGIVGDLLYATMEKALSASPKIYWGPLFNAALGDAAEKHILFALNDQGAQSGIRALNWAGAINQDFKGDYLHVNDANFAGAKSNMYIQDSMRIDYNIDSSGTIKKTVTLDYKNPHKYSDCNLESGGLCLNAVLRTFQRVYVPQGSTLVSTQGSQVKVTTKQDLGKTYFESFFTVDPLGKSEITYTYTLPFKAANHELPVLIQKQPGVEKITTEVYVNGALIDSFDLRQDKILNLKI